MLGSWRKFAGLSWWRPGDRQTYAALGVSTIVHACIITLLGLFSWGGGPDAAYSVVEWSPPSLPQLPLVPVESASKALEPTSTAPGGSSLGTAIFTVLPESAPLRPMVESPVRRPKDLSDVASGVLLGQKVRPLGGGGSGNGDGSGHYDTGGIGKGKGSGVGDGSGTSFFGLDAPGKKFVFVVDASGSMSRPFEGPGKSMLGRVKLEILKCVSQMSIDQQFFIVFFNDQAIPMPSSRLEPATPEAQQRFLRWMASAKPGGMTEPEEALLLAVRLEPDVIYFLTDGRFKYRVIERVSQMNRRGVTIHTVCFGDEDGEKFMREIAEKNGGTYQFVSAADATAPVTVPAAAPVADVESAAEVEAPAVR